MIAIFKFKKYLDTFETLILILFTFKNIIYILKNCEGNIQFVKMKFSNEIII
jgi:hypothetical protein